MSGKTPINRLEGMTSECSSVLRGSSGAKRTAWKQAGMSGSPFFFLVLLSAYICKACKDVSKSMSEQIERQRESQAWLAEMVLLNPKYVATTQTWSITAEGLLKKKKKAISCCCGLDNGAGWANKGVAQYLWGISPSFNKHSVYCRSVIYFHILFWGFKRTSLCREGYKLLTHVK